MELSASTILDGMVCGKPGCQCRPSARKGHGLTHCPAHDDQHPSLSVSERNGMVLFKCHSGCSQAEVVAALKAEGLWPERGGKRPGPGLKAVGVRADHNGPLPGPNEDSRVGGDSSHLLAAPGAPSVGADVSAPALSPARREHGTGTRLQSRLGHSVTRYEIREPDGSLAAVHLRFDGSQGKRMAWQMPDGSKGLGGRPATSLPLYGIDKLGDQIGVIVVEGEKCRDALAGLGLPAVGTVTGAATIPADAVLAQLAGRTVYLWPDADPPGQSHMERIAERLTALGCAVIKRVRWEGAEPGSDAADFIAQGGTMAEIQALLDAAGPWTAIEPAEDFHFSLPLSEMKSENANGTPGRAVDPASVGLIHLHDQAEPAVRRYAVEHLVPDGAVTTLYGDGGTGKSHLALSLATAVARGSGWLNRATRQQPVLYLDAELDIDEFARRAFQVARGLGLDRPPPQLYYLRLPGSLINSMVVDAVRAAIAESQATFVVVDSVMAATYGGELERAQDTTVVMKLLASFGTVLAIDHMAKPAPGANLSQYRQYGSVFKYNLSRSVIQAVRADGGGIQLRQIKHNFGPPEAPFGVALAFTDGAVVVQALAIDDDALAGIDDHLPAIEQVYRALAFFPDGTTPDVLTSNCDLSLGTVRNQLTTLRRQKRVVKEEGLWRIVSQVPQDVTDPVEAGSDAAD